MKIKGTEVNIKHLFKLDSKDPMTLLGGVFGVAHGLLTAGIMGTVFYVSLSMPFIRANILVAVAGALIMLYWYKKETRNFTIGLHEARKTAFYTLDTQLDFYVPALVVVIFVLTRAL